MKFFYLHTTLNKMCASELINNLWCIQRRTNNFQEFVLLYVYLFLFLYIYFFYGFLIFHSFYDRALFWVLTFIWLLFRASNGHCNFKLISLNHSYVPCINKPRKMFNNIFIEQTTWLYNLTNIHVDENTPIQQRRRTTNEITKNSKW